jgi:hypothetical protein
MSKKDITPPCPRPKADVKEVLADKVKAVKTGQTVQK